MSFDRSRAFTESVGKPEQGSNGQPKYASSSRTPRLERDSSLLTGAPTDGYRKDVARALESGVSQVAAEPSLQRNLKQLNDALSTLPGVMRDMQLSRRSDATEAATSLNCY